MVSTKRSELCPPHARVCVANVHHSYDTPPPAECDDEFWDDVYAENRFKQPPGKPSTMSFFLSYLQLLDILSTAVKNLYATKKSRFILGVTGKEWEHKIVNQLDLQLSAWLDSIPRHCECSSLLPFM